MVAAAGDRWQADAVRRLARVSVLAALAVIGGPPAGAETSGPPAPVVAQATVPAPSPDVPQVMAFTWTLYPRMWAELDLRLAASAEAVAEVSAEGGEVRWNLHVHPVETSPATFVTLAQGVAARATVRCAPDADGRYSYLFENDGNAGPVRLRIELRLRGDARLEAVKP
jgi:hypothetical protein